MKNFEYFSSLLNFYDENFKITKKNETKIKKAAIKWLANFGYEFGTHNVGCKAKVVYYYSAGSLIFSVIGLGGYTYRFIIELYHFAHFKTHYFIEGYNYGKKVKSGNKTGNLRDENPYDQNRIYEMKNWDCGYILGLSDYTIESFIDLFNAPS